MLAIQRGCRATTRRPSFVYKKAVPITTTRFPDKVKQLVLPFKVIYLVHQSILLTKVKQLVLLHQLIYFLITSLATGSERTYLSHRENVSEEPRERISPYHSLFPLSTFLFTSPFHFFPYFFGSFRKSS